MKQLPIEMGVFRIWRGIREEATREEPQNSAKKQNTPSVVAKGVFSKN
jgi:hypothetical protein